VATLQETVVNLRASLDADAMLYGRHLKSFCSPYAVNLAQRPTSRPRSPVQAHGA
jgi:hypothetical protein